MNNRRNAASQEFDRVIIRLQKEYDLTTIELIALLSSKTAEISGSLVLEEKAPVKNEPIENMIMREIIGLEKIGRK